MHRLIVAAGLAVVFLAAAGCADGTVAARPSASAPAQPTATSSPSPDPLARAICDDLNTQILDVDAKAFGSELGKMIAARAQNNKAEETRAQQAAVAKLGEISGKLRRHAGTATDPRLRDALTDSADNLDRFAADTANLTSLKSLDAVSETTRRFAATFSALTEYCAGI